MHFEARQKECCNFHLVDGLFLEFLKLNCASKVYIML